jgi:dinuclear metal center YbgI/SA1388 family protein
MKVEDIITLLEDLFPPELQESYDNSGEQIIFPESDVSSVLLALDIDNDVIDEASGKESALIITHHPFFFKQIKNIVSGNPKSDMILKLIDNRISVYSAHTNLDKVYYSKLSESLGLTEHRLLIEKGFMDENTPAGFGTLSLLREKITLSQLLDLIKSKLGLDYLLVSGPVDAVISKIAILNGSGGNSIESIIDKYDVDCIVTGDIGYHNSRIGIEYSVPVIDAGHFGTEKILIDFLKNELVNKVHQNYPGEKITFFHSEREKNPIRLYV